MSNAKQEVSGNIGFRTVRLVQNKNAWEKPDLFPKTRSTPPITIELNGRKIFAKGSNWVTPEIFNGKTNYDTYEPLISLAKDANINIFRCWGGLIIDKEPFFELCDKFGIMVWQEFPLACNCYSDDKHYIEILEQEATAIVKRLRKHASVIMWCGGNELFNSWSKMTDQSHALRLLNKICFEYDKNTPFIMTSPLMGMAHGCYTFYDEKCNQDVFEMFSLRENNAYTEFGISSISPVEYLREFIPEEELFPIRETESYILHHGLKEWGDEGWICKTNSFIDSAE